MLPSLPLIPLPTSVLLTGGEPFRLDPDTPVHGDAAAIEVVRVLLPEQTRAADGSGTAPAITATITGAGAPESYRLSVSAAGIELAGADAAGLFYAVQTLRQLRTERPDGAEIPAVEISDRPRFAYRGVMLDVARHFFDVATVFAYLDRAASLKFNVLHLHLTDDQGWRVQIRSWPLLTERGASSAVGGARGGFFSQRDYQDIVEYAAERHITVVPEVDAPGHTHAVSLAYPELCEQPVVTETVLEILRDFGGDTPVLGTDFTGIAVGFSSLRIGAPETTQFLTDVYRELAELSPGPYLHIGGDEALGTDPDAFAAFMAEASALAVAAGKIPIAWHEAGAAAGLARGTVGQYWGFLTPQPGMAEHARGFVERGGSLILSPADAVYLDMKPDAESPLGLTWANGPTSLRRAYEWEPSEVVDGIEETDILGVEAPLWTETVATLADIDALVFPRVGAAAEAAWSVPLGSVPERSWEHFRARTAALLPSWHDEGIASGPITP